MCREGVAVNQAEKKGQEEWWRRGSFGSVPPELQNKMAAEQQAFRELTRNVFLYIRVGYDLRPMRFEPGGLVGLGAGGCEILWAIHCERGEVWLDIGSEHTRTCRLKKDRAGVWRGAWEVHELMPIELVPVPVRLLGARPPTPA